MMARSGRARRPFHEMTKTLITQWIMGRWLTGRAFPRVRSGHATGPLRRIHLFPNVAFKLPCVMQEKPFIQHEGTLGQELPGASCAQDNDCAKESAEINKQLSTISQTLSSLTNKIDELLKPNQPVTKAKAYILCKGKLKYMPISPLLPTLFPLHPFFPLHLSSTIYPLLHPLPPPPSILYPLLPPSSTPSSLHPLPPPPSILYPPPPHHPLPPPPTILYPLLPPSSTHSSHHPLPTPPTILYPLPSTILYPLPPSLIYPLPPSSTPSLPPSSTPSILYPLLPLTLHCCCCSALAEGRMPLCQTLISCGRDMATCFNTTHLYAHLKRHSKISESASSARLTE
ncbi:hypothetical protein PR048_027765 [Dryococelus australis]|uniref:Uncharacterized protein n=1 Tax=Dryococelus australis TaxID=614101 RepID=A0ABQ9GHE7_9NEOP|nr:hypothetical protein PR048_027765 [Dryococelus australis]